MDWKGGDGGGRGVISADIVVVLLLLLWLASIAGVGLKYDSCYL